MIPEEKLLALLPELTEEEKDWRTREGLADVDAGRMIPHREMVALIKRLINGPAHAAGSDGRSQVRFREEYA